MDNLVMHSPPTSGGKLYDSLKRLFDLIVGLLLLLIAAPFLFLIALCIRLTSPGCVLYRQLRIGRDNQPFYVYKFRTMYADADRCGPLITSSDDPRITPAGRFLRDTKLDELPQLINVVRGDMSLVGPRPQVPRFVQHFDPDYQALILAVRPGITGPTQLQFRDEEEMLRGKEDREGYYISTLLPIKCKLDADYVLRRSLLYDAQVVLRTIGVFARGVLRRGRGERRPPLLERNILVPFREERTPEERADVELMR